MTESDGAFEENFDIFDFLSLLINSSAHSANNIIFMRKRNHVYCVQQLSFYGKACARYDYIVIF